MLKLIVATSSNDVIGIDGTLPWSCKADLQYFKEKTSNSVVIMGRTTWESLPKRPLPNRINVIVTSNTTPIPGAHVCNSLENAVKQFPDAWIIGGASIYKQCISLVDEIYKTIIDKPVHGNNCVKFSKIPMDLFTLTYRYSAGYQEDCKCNVIFEKFSKLL